MEALGVRKHFFLIMLLGSWKFLCDQSCDSIDIDPINVFYFVSLLSLLKQSLRKKSVMVW